MELPRFSPGEIAFLLVVPVAWAILLVFLGLSAFVALHDPPIGPPALLCFAGAVALLARSQRAPAVSAPAPASDT
jgi:uncharacterized RDD family membrane protein YckC